MTRLWQSLVECSQLRQLGIAHTKLTNEGLARLTKLRDIEALVLHDTRISDAGLAHLEGRPHLKGLWLGGTNTSPKGLAHLSGLQGTGILGTESHFTRFATRVHRERALLGPIQHASLRTTI